MVKKIENKHNNKLAKEKPPKQQNYELAQNKYNNFDVAIKTILLKLILPPIFKTILNLKIDTTKIRS